MSGNTFDRDDPVMKGMVDSLVESAYRRGWEDAIVAVRDRFNGEQAEHINSSKGTVYVPLDL